MNKDNMSSTENQGVSFQALEEQALTDTLHLPEADQFAAVAETAPKNHTGS